jgi:peptidoglycan hydrolase-like protein with peptidoglycan-binding domain
MILSKDDSGQQVIRLQVGLQKAGFGLPQYGIDGKFGSETQSAVMEAQRRFSLPVTGEAGPTLLAKLGVSNAPLNMKTDKKAMLTKAVLAGIAIGALFMIAKKMRNR